MFLVPRDKRPGLWGAVLVQLGCSARPLSLPERVR